MKNLLRRVGALTAAVMMCFALTVPALADETLVNDTATAYVFMSSGSSWSAIAQENISTAGGSGTPQFLGQSVPYGGLRYLSFPSSVFTTLATYDAGRFSLQKGKIWNT